MLYWDYLNWFQNEILVSKILSYNVLKIDFEKSIPD